MRVSVAAGPWGSGGGGRSTVGQRDVSATTAQAQDLDFTLYAKEIPGEEESPTGAPPAVGDSFAFADDLFRSKGGERAGRDGVACTVVRAGNPVDLMCVGTFVLTGDPGGQISGQTLLSLDPAAEQEPPFDIAVTGGTGDFEDARGTIRSTPDGEYARLDFRISN